MELLCRNDAVERVIDIVRRTAGTGRRGDGVVVVSEVEEIVSVRTGDRDEIALL